MSNEPQGDLSVAPNSLFIPGPAENYKFRADCIPMCADILTRNIPIIQKAFAGLFPDRFTHEYTAAMSVKSHIEPLGIWDLDENKNDKILELMKELQPMVVPGVRSDEDQSHIDWKEPLEHTHIRPVPIVGDQKVV